MADFFELLNTRRSIRAFEDREVPLEMISQLIRDCCLAPSANHGQPWNFTIVNNRQWIKRISDESKRNILIGIEKNPSDPMKQYEEALKNDRFNVFWDAPCVVFIVGPRSVTSLYVDCSLAACYFMLSAAARGLGTCWIGLGANIADPETMDALGIPEGYSIVAPIAVGYPKLIPKPSERNEPNILKVVS
jgi:nitroreductase